MGTLEGLHWSCGESGWQTSTLQRNREAALTDWVCQ
jgi:hypothetical protein